MKTKTLKLWETKSVSFPCPLKSGPTGMLQGETQTPANT